MMSIKKNGTIPHDHLFSMKVSMATTSFTDESFFSPLSSIWSELSTAINSMATSQDGMVPPTLSILGDYS